MDETVEGIDIDHLTEALEKFPLSLVLVFGSTVTGEAHSLSDLDIAIRWADEVDDRTRIESMAKLHAAASSATGHDAVDIVDIEWARAALAYRALAQGRLLIGEEEEATALEAKKLVERLDFEPIEREWKRELRQRIEEGSYG